MTLKNIGNYVCNRRALFIVLIFLIPVLIIDGLNYFELPDIESLESEKVEVLIPKGATLEQIADSLLVKGLIDDVKVFKFWAVSLGYDTRLKAGLFEIPEGLNAVQKLEYLTHARAKEIYVTLLEGWDNRQISRELSRKLGINKAHFDSLCQDRTFIKNLGLEVDNLTGYLLPDTYALYWGMREQELVTFLSTNTLNLFNNDSARSVMNERSMSRHQILTMASIIEGEALIDAERPIIASVYYNRLNRRMRLQADPTIQYIIDGPPRRLLERDLQIDSPYNTYKYYGLPPGPINNPGASSIRAALYPADTKYLYFVARGDGGHTFSNTLKEHNEAKAEFDKIRRQVRKQKINASQSEDK